MCRRVRGGAVWGAGGVDGHALGVRLSLGAILYKTLGHCRIVDNYAFRVYTLRAHSRGAFTCGGGCRGRAAAAVRLGGGGAGGVGGWGRVGNEGRFVEPHVALLNHCCATGGGRHRHVGRQARRRTGR